MDTIRFGLIGYGKVAQVHAQALLEASKASLVAVCGRNASRRDEFAAQWGVASRETVAEMVELDHVDAVIIATPHPQHHADALAAFAAGCHVLVEKPMALNEAECTDMILAAEQAGKVLSVVSQRRWIPACMRIREAIDSGKLGTPAIAQVTVYGWRDQEYYESDPWRGKWDSEGGGIVINQASHHIDLMQWFMGPVTRVHAEWDNVNHPYIEVEDTAVATVRFANGGMASILVSNSQKPGIYTKVHVHGSSGASVGVLADRGPMFIAGGDKGEVNAPINDLWTIEGEQALLATFVQQDEAFYKTLKDPTIYLFARQIEDVVRAIHGKTKPLVTGEDGREAVRIIDGIYRSGREHVPISFS